MDQNTDKNLNTQTPGKSLESTSSKPFLFQQDIAPGSVKQQHLLPSGNRAGDLYYGKDGLSFTNLAIGTTGQILTVNAGVPVWAANTASQIPTVTALSGTTPTLTCTGTKNIIFTLTLSGSTTYSITGASAGQILIVEVKQGSGTTYTNTWFSGVTWITSGAAAPVQTTTSSGITTYGFRVLTSSTFLGYLIATQ